MTTRLPGIALVALLLTSAPLLLEAKELPAAKKTASAKKSASAKKTGSAEKTAALAAVDRHSLELIALSDQIWAFAETALREQRSAKALADYAESQGFRVERGVAGMPTAFVASYGEGRPMLGVLGEYDALPGLSQRATTAKEPLAAGAPGHGCGHNLFGAASLGAALAVKELIAAGKLQGTVRFYGTPAEEDVGGKTYMARDGFFADLDAVLAWHPSYSTQADTTTGQALVDVAIEFHGRAAHAASDPWNGRSAVDAAELFTHGINMMREHILPSSRLHYTIASGGDVPNVVPEYAKVSLWVRDAKRAEVENLLARVRKLAEGAATMTETTSEVRVMAGSWEMLVNEPGARLLDANLRAIGVPQYSDEEIAFATALQQATGAPFAGMDTTIGEPFGQQEEGGSTDVADVSWVTPTLHFSAVTTPNTVPWHAWPVVAASGMSIGHKGLVFAAKTLAATLVDLYQQPALLAAVRQDFETKKGATVFKAYLPDGPPPVPEGHPDNRR